MSKSQNEQVLALLRKGPLNPLQALSGAGCFRLAARIGELRERGYQIESRMVAVPGGRHVAEYRLAKP